MAAMNTDRERDLAAAGPLTSSSAPALSAALAEIAAGAEARDASQEPQFPDDAFRALRRCGALDFNAFAGEQRPAAAVELSLVRLVAAADGSVGRIFDGHLNAVERLAVQAPGELRDQELALVLAGELLAGVWGGDPVGDEGRPATVAGDVLRGAKTFCSGAGGLDRAAVLARGEDGGQPLLVWIDVADSSHVEVDTSWYRARGLVASVSHRVVFHDAPVLARLGGPGSISAQPWFGRDALRTAASWAGMADTAVRAALATLAERPARSELEELAAGRILTAQRTIDVWLDHAAVAMDRAAPELGSVALHAPRGDRRQLPRVARRGRTLLRLAAVRARSGAGSRAPRPRALPAATPARSAARACRPRQHSTSRLKPARPEVAHGPHDPQ